jgi:hypothetical protein
MAKPKKTAEPGTFTQSTEPGIEYNGDTSVNQVNTNIEVFYQVHSISAQTTRNSSSSLPLLPLSSPL